MRHQLGIVASLAYDMTLQREDYGAKIEVSEDVIEWLGLHDSKLDENGSRIYICNAIEYIYLGPVPEVKKLPIDFFNPGKENLA